MRVRVLQRVAGPAGNYGVGEHEIEDSFAEALVACGAAERLSVPPPPVEVVEEVEEQVVEPEVETAVRPRKGRSKKASGRKGS